MAQFSGFKAPRISDPEIESAFLALARYLNEPLEYRLQPSYAEPEKPRTGMLVYADGTDWNPGSGEGVYVYTSGGSWSKL